MEPEYTDSKAYTWPSSPREAPVADERMMQKVCPIMWGLDLEKTKELSVHLFPMVSVSLGSPAQQKDFGVLISFMKGDCFLEENLLGSQPTLWSLCCQDIVYFLFSFFLNSVQCGGKCKMLESFSLVSLQEADHYLAFGNKETLTPTNDFYRVAFHSCNTRGSSSNLALWLYPKILYIHFYITDIFTLKQNTILVKNKH